MKNLSSIPCLSLFEAFTILITLAVCLAGFTEAEVHTNLRQSAGEKYASMDAPNGEEASYSQKTAQLKSGGELHSGDFGNSNKFRVGSLEKLIKSQSDDFGESDSEAEKENDGYGYDDDEYYHVNYKRNDDAVGNAESNKMSKESIGEMNRKEGFLSSQKAANSKGQKENEKDMQTIEMLNFKEFHPNIGGGTDNSSQVGNAIANANANANANQNPRPFTFESSHRKLPSSSLDSLNMRDLKENSAIDEKMKDRKDESGILGGSSDSKVVESKKGLKTDDKEGIKLKDAKIAESSEKKEKEAGLKDVKENVASKSLKDSAKSSEEKEKSLKLSESAKLEENLNAKSKEGETAKITKEDKDSSKLTGKAIVDVINPNDISQISNRASFVSSDYKDNMEAMKSTAVEDDEKSSDELNENEKNVGLSDYDDFRDRQLVLQGNSLISPQDAVKAGDYLSFPLAFEMKNNGENEYFKKRESWKDHGKFHLQQEQPMQMDQAQQQQQQQMPQNQNFEHDIKNLYHLKFPPSELENTEYHKNFIKSLKRYKGLTENAKVLNPESTSFSSVDKSSYQSRRKKKRSQAKKRRSMLSMEADKAEGGHLKSRSSDLDVSGQSQWFLQQGQSPQESKAQGESKLFGNKKYTGQQENLRQRRKSPAKLEYEIKIINQNQHDSKGSPLTPLRMKKEVKTKLATDDKYLKKYPYSQASRDDLSKVRNLERKYKRKAPVWMRKDTSKDSVVQTRGLPSGYYGNRVKFGQKSYARTEDKSNSEQPISDVKLSYMQTPAEKSGFQRTWELKSPDYKHDPMKRYDGTSLGGSNSHNGNSLLLIRKGQNGERITKTFEESKARDQDEKLDADHLAKLLSKDDDYLVLKKTENNKYRKVMEPVQPQQEDSSVSSQQNKKVALESQVKQSAKNKGVYARSSHKEVKKFAGLHGTAGKSNLKKTFEKFRDLADFFKDNEQESADNQFQSQEIKEGRDIVFSEDKLPDPIVISSDANGKTDSFNQKPTNSIYSISTNFKHLDQQDRKEDAPKDNDKNPLAAEVKPDSQEFSWEPALKNAFPEAKTINAMSKNGNEIIVLDFNRNQLKNEHGFLPAAKPNTKSSQGVGSVWAPGGRSLTSLGQRQVEVVMPTQMFDKSRRDEDRNHQEGPMAVFNGAEGTQVSIPLNQLAQLPYLFKSLADKKQNVGAKTVVKKSAKWGGQQNMMSDNYNQFLKDLQELSELNKKGKLTGKRSSEQILLPASSMPELTAYSDVNVRKLGSLLQNILSNQNVKVENDKVADNSINQNYMKAWYPAAYDARHQRLSPETKVRQELHGPSKEMELWEELTEATRHRREEIGKRKQRNTSKGYECPADMKDKCMIKPEASGSKEAARDTAVEKVSEEEGGRESGSLKADFEGHLNELFENLSSEKNQKDVLNMPNESTANRGKRKDSDRGKRSSRRDVKNKVSTTEVQNKLLKNLPEDNYPSVYSPGIKRRLLSTGNEMEDAGGYNGADEHDRSEMIAKGGEANFAKNDRNKYIDPIILELFGAEDAPTQKNRNRRSLTAGFHSDFKREIDLDESMPNDFQNFLVTSLGGVGSQKREVVKKEEALWEGKDSALEKREVSSGEKQKGAGTYFGTATASNSKKSATAHSQKLVRSEDKSSIETKNSEFDDKVPTQIRIQITNAAEKEKKSTKENESPSADVDSTSKEKDYFDKSKMGQLGVNALPKLHQFPKQKYSLLDYEDCDSGDSAKQKTYAPRTYRRRRRKKKKYVPENPMKPIKDFIAFDQKAMEILLRKYMADQSLAGQTHTTQKAPMSNHLPQVETVYNPTQGTNKAQLDSSRIAKINSVSNKNSENAKNSLQSNDASAYDENILRSYLKDKTSKTKSDKPYGKEYEELEWNPYLGKFRQRSDLMRDNMSFQSKKNFGSDVSSLSHVANTPSSRVFNPYVQGPYYQKWLQGPYNNYLNHPPNMNVVNSNSFYDALKLKQELKNHNKGMMMKDHSAVKTSQKQPYFNDGNFYTKTEDKDRNLNYPTTVEPAWNYDFNFNKKPFAQPPKIRDYYSTPMKTQPKTYAPSKSKFIKSMDDDKLFDNTLLHPLDNSKDCDYLDVLDDEYPDDDAGKDLQFDEPIITDVIKKSNKLYDPVAYHLMYSNKNSEVDSEGPADSDDEFEDEYDEAADDDDLDDYSLLANSREAEPELSKNPHATFQGSYRPEDSSSHLSTFYPRSSQFELKGNSFEQTEYNNPKSEVQQARQTMPLLSSQSDMDPSLSGSSSILKKANDNANIFGKNLLKNLNKYNYDDTWKHPDKSQEDKPLTDMYPRFGRKLRKRKMELQRKMKRGQQPPQIGSRLFYISKVEMPDRGDNPGGTSINTLSRRQGIPLVAQFAAPDDLEYDSESKVEALNELSYPEDDLEVEDNLEDDGETISEDNVLENVIGKYIMRKRVHSPKSDAVKVLRKRSTEAYQQKPQKLLQKRLSSGHLTENNFKKFHKKYFSEKRGIIGVRHKVRRDRPPEGQNHEKRSALDLLKRIANKDRDSKKMDDSECHSAGFEPILLLSDKKPETETKEKQRFQVIEGPEPVEPKLLLGNELKDAAPERKKEKAKVSLKLEGPWKLELKDRLEVTGREWSAAEGGHRKEGEEESSGHVRAPPPAVGSFQTEVGTSGPSRPVFDSHVRKRSLEPPMALRREASLTQEHNRALHDSQNLSKPEALQRNTHKTGSFVADDDPAPRFPPTGESTNLKSLFPPSSNANIIRDSRDISEGTSEYLGQQIVGAILSHVSANPKFKELIAPGLTMKASPPHREAIDQKRRALHQMDFSEQLQSFLQKFLFDLEKLAERHVKKRMCNELDKPSRDFLQSLLNIPAGRKETALDASCSGSEDVPEFAPAPATATAALPTSSSPSNFLPPEVNQIILANLQKKQALLKKLIREYRNLSKLEQETLNVNYKYLVQELEQTNRELSLHDRVSCLAPELCDQKIAFRSRMKSKKFDFQHPYNGSFSQENWLLKPAFPGPMKTFVSSTPEWTSKKTPEKPSSPRFSTYVFTPTDENNAGSTTTINPKAFEDVQTQMLNRGTSPPPLIQKGKVVDSSSEQDLNAPFTASEMSVSSQTASVNDMVPLLSTPTPQSFDLLPSQNSSADGAGSESVRIKQSAPRASSVDKENFREDYHQQSALNKLSTADAAGLQLSLKTHGPWISTLDFAKSYKAIPEDILMPPKGKIAGTDPGLKRAFNAPRDHLCSLAPGRRGNTHLPRPSLPCDVDNKLFTRKERPFLRVTEAGPKDTMQNCQMQPLQYYLKKCPTTHKKVRAPSSKQNTEKFHPYSGYRKKSTRYTTHNSERGTLRKAVARSWSAEPV